MPLLIKGTRMLTVTRALEFVIDFYVKCYPERTNPVDWINQARERSDGVMIAGSGICYQVAKAIQTVMPEVKHNYLCLVASCGNNEFGEYPLHCVIHHEGRYYDTMNLDGVDDIYQLGWCIDNNVQDEVFLPENADDFETFDRCYRDLPLDHFTYELILALKAFASDQ